MATSTNIRPRQPIPVAHRTVAFLAHIPNVTSVSSSATRRLLTNGTSDYSCATRSYYCHTGLLKCVPYLLLPHRTAQVRSVFITATQDCSSAFRNYYCHTGLLKCVPYLLLPHRTAQVRSVLITATQDCSSAFRTYYCHIGLF